MAKEHRIRHHRQNLHKGSCYDRTELILECSELCFLRLALGDFDIKY